MNHTRGGAIGVVQVAGPVIRFAGLGNIVALTLADGTRRGMLSVPGIAGHQARTIRQFEYDAPPARRSSCTPTASAAAGSPGCCRA